MAFGMSNVNNKFSTIMNNLIISHMDARVLKHFDHYANNPVKLRAALIAYMKRVGITPMEDNIAVMEYLFRHRSHMVAEKIFTELHSTIRTLTRASVRSTLEILAQLGTIEIIHLDTYYMKSEDNTTPHAHFICACCGAIENISLTENITHMIKIPHGARINDIQIMCLGLCSKCNAKKAIN